MAEIDRDCYGNPIRKRDERETAPQTLQERVEAIMRPTSVPNVIIRRT